MGSKKVTLCLFLFEFFASIPLCLLQSATEDIMAGTLIQSSLVLTLCGIGAFCSNALGYLLVKWSKLSTIMVLVILLFLVSWLFIVLGHDTNTRLVGTFTTGLAFGLQLVTGLCFLSLYDDIEEKSSAFLAGTNAATFFVGILYTGSTVWLCFPPRTTFAFVFALAFFCVPFYAILNHGPLKKYQIQEEIKYSQLQEKDDTGHKHHASGFNYYLHFLYKVFPSLAYFFLNVILCRFVTNSIVTSLTFPSSPFRVRDHFQYYTYTFDIGRILGTCDTFIVAWLCPSWKERFQFRQHVWVLVLLSFGHLLFFLSATWYRFLSNVYIVLVLCVTQGILTSAIFVRALSLVGYKFKASSSEKRQACIIAETGATFGFIVSGLIGIYVEEILRQHCVNELALGEYCIARFSSSIGWSTSWQCAS